MQIIKKLTLLCLLTVLALPLVGGVGVAAAQNLLVNPDFESGDLAGWLVFGESANSGTTVVSTDNGPSLPGTNNAYMDNHAEAMGLTLKQSTPAGSAGPGTVYFSMDLKLDQADNGGVLFYEIFAEQANGGVVGTSGLVGPLWAWEWTMYQGSFVAPASTDFLTIQIMANTGAAVGSNCLAHVDNVFLSQEGEPVSSDSANLDSIKALYR